jgi:hypothetical protein
VGAGIGNTAANLSGVVVGGDSNYVGVDFGGNYSFIGAGRLNSARARSAFVGGGENNSANGNFSTVAGGVSNSASNVYSAIPGGSGLSLNGSGSFGFLGGNTGSNNMTVNAVNTSVFGNTNLWLANNNGTASALYFYAPNNTSGAFPGSTDYVGFQAGSVTTSTIWTLPTADGTNGQVLQTNGSAALNWATVRNNWVSVPASSSASGNPGDEAYDSNYLYICVSANTWERVALSSW